MNLFGLTTDDGVDASGYAALVTAFDAHSPICIAPATGISSLGTAAIDQIGRPNCRQFKRFGDRGVVARVIQGSAAVAARELVRELQVALRSLASRRSRPLIVVGVNHGPNVGEKLVHSGTFGAALVASWLGCTAVAVSLDDVYSVDERSPGELRFGYAASAARILAGIVASDCPKGSLINLNVPNTIEPTVTKAVAATTYTGRQNRSSGTEALWLERGCMVVSVMKLNSLAADFALSRLVARKLSTGWRNL